MKLICEGDYKLSPYTGYTRQHWVEITKKIVSGFMPYVDKKTGVINLTGNPEETYLHEHLTAPGKLVEAFERTQMAVASYIAATNQTRIPGYNGDIAEIYRKGMDLFTNPKSPYVPKGRQYIFGSGSVLAMLLAPKHFIDSLDKKVKKNVANALSTIIHRHQNPTNTFLFSMMPAVVMDRLGAKYDRKLLDDHFENILGMYRGNGWFIDGWNQGFDHYNFWGFQLYLHALMHFDERWRKKYRVRVKEITEKHEETLQYFFGKDGGPIPKGRSLNYRFACVSGIGYSQLSGLSSMDPGVARRICSGCLKYFWDHGVLSERGLIEPGFRASNSCVGENYTDFGAPYWSITGLVPVILPEKHLFWNAKEKPIETDKPGIRRFLVTGANMVLKADGNRGEARMHIAGDPFKHRKVWQAGSKYFPHSISSTVGYALTGEWGRQLAVNRTGISSDKKNWSFRTWPRVLLLDEKRAISEWDAWPGLAGETGTIVTESFFLDKGEKHVFWHTSKEPKYLCIGGYSIKIEHGEKPESRISKKEAIITSSYMWSKMKVLKSVTGKIVVKNVKPSPGFKHSHIFEGWSAYPEWVSNKPVRPYEKITVWVDGGIINT